MFEFCILEGLNKDFFVLFCKEHCNASKFDQIYPPEIRVLERTEFLDLVLT